MFIIKILVLFLMMFHNAFCFSKHPSEEQIQMYDYLKLHKEYSQDVFNLYEKNVAKLLWIEDSKVSSNVLDLIEAIKKSKYHGLIPNQYYLNEITTLVNEKSTNIYKLDTLLSAAFCKLARDLHFAQHHSEVSVIGQKQKEENFDLHRLLIQALKSKSIQGTLKSLAPKHTYYWRLYDYLKQHDVTSMDEKLIATNMDRWRLYTSEVPKNYILINLAAFWLDVVYDTKSLFSMRVIVGKESTKTPLIESDIETLVFNPYWYIPQSIFDKNLLHRAKKYPQLLEKRGISAFEISQLQDDKKIKLSEINFHNDSYKDYIFREDPSRKNPLGGIKIIFKNSHNIYLHDTPDKEKFMHAKRAYSSGCIRISQPEKLASYLLNYHNDMKYSIQDIATMIDYHNTQVFTMKKMMHIYITYQTAWIDDYGVLHKEKDYYQHDVK